MPEELPPVPPTPIDSETTWKKSSKMTYTMRGDGTFRKNTVTEESSETKKAPGKEFRSINGEDFLKAKLRPTGVKLDMAQDGTDEQPHYK